MLKSEVLAKIEDISSKQALSADDVSKLSLLIEKLKSIDDDINLSELIDLFPALQKYKEEHSIINLQKLCVELSEFCRAVYASTRNDEERKVYHRMLEKLNK